MTGQEWWQIVKRMRLFRRVMRLRYERTADDRLTIAERAIGRIADFAPSEADETPPHTQIAVFAKRAAFSAIADRNPTGGDVKQAPSRSDESGGAATQQSHNTSSITQSTD